VELHEEPPRFFVIFAGLELPEWCAPRSTRLMMMADYQYPLSALDMFWTDPPIQTATGGWPQNADQFEQHVNGTSWQRWSWHYEWDPARHNVLSHLDVFFDRLAKGS
jgi:hypothetical protein